MTKPKAQVRTAQVADRAGVWPLAREFATSFVPVQALFDSTYEQLLGRDDTLWSSPRSRNASRATSWPVTT